LTAEILRHAYKPYALFYLCHNVFIGCGILNVCSVYLMLMAKGIAYAGIAKITYEFFNGKAN
jgi:hypothetical protein